MKTCSRVYSVVIVALLSVAVLAVAGVPQLITVQGQLTDSTGSVVADADYVLTFTIYDAPVGGTDVWTSGGQTVPVAGGVFVYQLGSDVTLPHDLFVTDTVRYLGITVAADPEIDPRTRLTSGSYVYQALRSDTAAYALAAPGGGSGGGWADDGTVIRLETASDSVGIGTATPSAKLEVDGDVIINGRATIGSSNVNSGGYGFVAGRGNSVTGDLSAVSGGQENIAGGMFSSVGGGANNRARGDYSVVAGGGGEEIIDSNLAGGTYSVVSGGRGNIATGMGAGVGGGTDNTASGNRATIGGGGTNSSTFNYTTVAGGSGNTASGSVSAVVGGQANTASGGVSFVGGGSFNEASGLHSVIGGGGGTHPSDSNLASGDLTFIGGGRSNKASGDYAVIGGGDDNTSSGVRSTVGGGRTNNAAAPGATIAGGHNNQATGDTSTVGGGYVNQATGSYSYVGGGDRSRAGGSRAAIGGGGENIATGDYATIAGGDGNTVSGDSSTVAGGAGNQASGRGSVSGGGIINNASGNWSTVAGGYANLANAQGATVGGGRFDTASAQDATVAGGQNNMASNTYATVSGGSHNTANASSSTVGGGSSNRASGNYSTVPGGLFNIANGEYSVAIGKNARANHDGSVVISATRFSSPNNAADSVRSGGIEQMVLRADGGLFLTNSAGLAAYDASRLITTRGGAYLSGNGTAWTNASDRNKKENFRNFGGVDLLNKIDQLPIMRWNYKGEDESITHIGPTAQDFYSLFEVGADTISISTIDPAGIALAAIQELHKRTQKIDDLEMKVCRLEALVESLLALQNRSGNVDSDELTLNK